MKGKLYSHWQFIEVDRFIATRAIQDWFNIGISHPSKCNDALYNEQSCHPISLHFLKTKATVSTTWHCNKIIHLLSFCSTTVAQLNYLRREANKKVNETICGSITYVFFTVSIDYFQAAILSRSPNFYRAIQWTREQILIPAHERLHNIIMPIQCHNTLPIFMIPNLKQKIRTEINSFFFPLHISKQNIWSLCTYKENDNYN